MNDQNPNDPQNPNSNLTGQVPEAPAAAPPSPTPGLPNPQLPIDPTQVQFQPPGSLDASTPSVPETPVSPSPLQTLPNNFSQDPFAQAPNPVQSNPPPIPTFPLPGNVPIETPQQAGAELSAVGQIDTAGLPQNPMSNPAPQISMSNNPALNNPEPAPTDLSQLTGNNDQQPPPDVYIPPVSSPENLVVPSAPSASADSVKAPNGHSSKKGLFFIIGAILILLVVSSASAYFFFGIGKSRSPEPASVPAEQAPLTTPPQPLEPSPTPEATESAVQSSLGGLTPSPSPSGLSAIERLKQRQGSTSSGTTP